MNHRSQLIILAIASAMLLPGCNLIKKAAKGDKITRDDMVNEGDRAYQQNERDREQVARIEASIDEDLKEIEELRQTGRFSSADYRKRSLEKRLVELKKLDSRNAKLTSAPKKVGELESTYTEDVYNRKVLGTQCAELVERAKTGKMEENWSQTDRALTDYAKCRRKMVDAQLAQGEIDELDKRAIPEYDGYLAYLLEQVSAFRKEKDFYRSSGFEATLDKHVKYYQEISPKSKKPAETLAKLETTRKKYRDPKEVEAEQAKGAFDAWSDQVTKAFNAEWDKIAAAEATARPLYEEGLAALESGDAKSAEAKFLAARQTLYNTAYPSSVALETAYRNGALEKGLSYEIAAALARLYFEQGVKAKLYPELSIIKVGRPWMSKEEELQIRHYDVLADQNGKLAPKPTDPVRTYAGRYSDVGKQFKGVAEVAQARRGEAYNLMGVDIELISHRVGASDPSANAGKVVFVEEPVDDVRGNTLRFDFQREYEVPTKCWNTNTVSSVNLYTGQVYYAQKCNYKKQKDGYVLVVAVPKGVKVAKGDQVSFYATVGSKKGQTELLLDNPGYVRVAPKGETSWFLGTSVK